MTRILAVLFDGLGLSAVAAPPTQPAAVNTQSDTTERIDFAPGGLIRVDHFTGYLKVEGWDRPEVEITVIKALPYDYPALPPEQGAQRLEAVHVASVRSSGRELDISTSVAAGQDRFARSVMVDVEIHVPRDSRLAIHHHGGSYILVSNVAGDIEATGGNGDIVLMLPDSGVYAIDAKSGFGIVASDFSGTTHRRLLVGERFDRASAGSSHRVYARVNLEASPSSPSRRM